MADGAHVIPRTEWRRRQREKTNPNDSWIAPEHAKLNGCRRLRHNLYDERGKILAKAGELLLPGSPLLKAQSAAEFRRSQILPSPSAQ